MNFRTAEPALKDVSLAVRKGDFVIVTGPNGAGKTTLLMSMAGAIPHYYGGTMQGMVFTDGDGDSVSSIFDPKKEGGPRYGPPEGSHQAGMCACITCRTAQKL